MSEEEHKTYLQPFIILFQLEKVGFYQKYDVILILNRQRIHQDYLSRSFKNFPYHIFILIRLSYYYYIDSGQKQILQGKTIK